MSPGRRGLVLLAKLKLRGAVRRQFRRLKRPSGIAFAVVGLGLTVLWIAGILFGQLAKDTPRADAELLEPMAQVVGLVLLVMTVSGSLTHRGLVLPKEELDLLLSAPVSRADLVRYRLLVNTARASLGGVFFGLFAMWRMPLPPLAFFGCLLAMQTLPLVGQAISLTAGGAENRLLRRIPKAGPLVLNLAAALFLSLVVLVFMLGSERVGEKLERFGLDGDLEDLFQHPWIEIVALPVKPWAAMVTAPDLGSFALWFAACAAAWIVLFELTARTPIDFRELSLQTSADVARRLQRLRTRGVGVSAGAAPKTSIGWRVPWIAGRGPFGAVVWRKSTGIVRKARTTLLLSLLVVAVIAVATSKLGGHSADSAVAASTFMFVFIGAVYLSAGLRFDFREEFEQMPSIKSWPLSPAKIFLATVLPQSLVISAFLAIGLGARAAVSARFHSLDVVAWTAAPLVAFTWVAVDNLVFLVAPVRYLPGQEGLLQHMGRSAVLVLLRIAVVGAMGAPVGGAVAAAIAITRALGVRSELAVASGAATGFSVLCGEIAVLIWLGGRCFRRFDVARDRV